MSLQDDLKLCLTVLVTAASFSEIFKILNAGSAGGFNNAFILCAACISLVYLLVKRLFDRFTGGKSSVFAVSSVALLLAFLLRNIRFADGNTAINTVSDEGYRSGMPQGISAGIITLCVYIVWALLTLTYEKLYVGALLCFISDTVIIYSYFSDGSDSLAGLTGRAVFSALFVLNISYILSLSKNLNQRIGAGKRHVRDTYPFSYFLIIFILLLIIPGRDEPINWKPVIEAGRSVVNKTRDMAQSVSYYFSEFNNKSGYQTGYSSFVQTGDTIHLSQRTELELSTKDSTTFRYTDEDSGKELMRRRVVYLKGGREQDKSRLLDILYSLYSGRITKEQAALFVRTSSLDIVYEYLKTEDVIVPECTFRLTDVKGIPFSADDRSVHKKGYSIHADYLDLDYGSPYFKTNINNEISLKGDFDVKEDNKAGINYETLASYAYETLGIKLTDSVSEEDFISWQKGDSIPGKEYLDTDGASERMRSLSSEITAGYTNDYDRCKAVEAYLRQYKYKTETGKRDKEKSQDTAPKNKADTGTAEGMSLIADDFLFESGEGYCVHFSSSMVMLLRLNDIPARFTTGYRYAFPFEKQDVYEVKASNAHAWPEAYISGFGWVGFEPTPAMTTAEDRTWHRQPVLSEAYDDAEYGVNNAYIPVPAAAVPNTDNTFNDGAEDTGSAARGESDKSSEILLKTTRITITMAVYVIFMIILIVAGKWLYKTVKYKRADLEGRLMTDVEDIIQIIRNHPECTFEDRGVISDYVDYIPDRFREEAEGAFEIYYRIKYRCKQAGMDRKAIGSYTVSGQRVNRSGMNSRTAGEQSVSVQEWSRVRNLRNMMYSGRKRLFKNEDISS